MSEIRVGINGFGRIGRLLFRAGFEKLNIVGINDTSGADSMAHLLKYDSSHGVLPNAIEAGGNTLSVDNKKIHISASRNPNEIPWEDWGVDVVLECTGAFKKKEDFQKHLRGSVKKVLVSAPADGADFTAVYGVNHEEYNKDQHHIISNASCTTNCLAPLAKVLHESFGITTGFMTTIHSYTNDQRLLDGGHNDLRRARSAAESMIPTTTGAAKAVGKVLPELNGKIDGVSIRVPTPNVSLVDFVANTEKEVSIESVNNAIVEAADGSLKGVLAYERAPLVSKDFMSHPASSIVDLPSTMVIEKNLFKVMSWYDNEMGFSHRMIDIVNYIEKQGL